MTSRDLMPLCRKWQKRMRLADWRIDIKFTRKLPEGAEFGHIEYDRLRQEAAILVLTPSLWKKPLDIEATTVHELGHLLMPDITPENEDGIEAAIDRYTEILIEAHK